jgi:hypothetical protein
MLPGQEEGGMVPVIIKMNSTKKYKESMIQKAGSLKR